MCLGLLSTGLQAGEQKGSSPSDVSQAGVTFSPRAQAQAYIDMAVEAHDRQGDLDGAEQWLERALEIDPYHPVARKMLEQVKTEKQQAGLQRMGVALGTLQQMMERMEQHKEDQAQEEGEPGQTEEASAGDEEPSTSPDESAAKGPVFGKGRAPVDTIRDSPEPKGSSSPGVQPTEEAGSHVQSPAGPSTEAFARALQLALPHQPIQESGPSPRQMYDEGKKEATYDPWHSPKGQTVDPSRLTKAGCSAQDMAELVGMLNETGLMGLLLEAVGGGTGQEGGGKPSGSEGGAPLPPVPQDGRNLQGFLLDICAKMKSIKPKGMGKMARGRRMGPGGCGFALAAGSQTGPGGEWGSRVRACIEKHSQQGPPPMESSAVRLPIKNCGRGRPKGGGRGERRVYPDEILLVRPSYKAILNGYPGGWTSPWSGGYDYQLLDDFGTSFRFTKDGELISVTQSKYNKDGSKVETEHTTWGTQIDKYYDKKGRWIGSETREYNNKGDLTKRIVTDGKTTVTTTYEDVPPKSGEGGEGRPVGPGEGDCDETPAQKRARAIFNCIFSGPPQVAPGGTPEPVTYPTGPAGPTLPADCDEINIAGVWGSSTIKWGGAYDPEGPEDFIQVGPTTKGYIPKVEGVIDPPKEAVSIPGGGKGKGKKGLPGDEDVPPGEGKDDD